MAIRLGNDGKEKTATSDPAYQVDMKRSHKVTLSSICVVDVQKTKESDSDAYA